MRSTYSIVVRNKWRLPSARGIARERFTTLFSGLKLKREAVAWCKGWNALHPSSDHQAAAEVVKVESEPKRKASKQ